MKILVWFRRWTRIGALILMGFLASLGFLRSTNFLERFFLDVRFLLANALSDESEMSPYVAVILMDTYSESIFGEAQFSEWRQFHPKLLDVLEEAGALVIAFDTEFHEQKIQWDGPFAAALRKSGNVLAGEIKPGDTQRDLKDAFRGIASLSVTLYSGVPRRVELSADRQPLSVLISRTFHELSDSSGLSDLPDFTHTGDGFWINFDKPIDRFPTYSYADVYNSEKGRMGNSGKTPLSIFQDKIVLIGTDVAHTPDRFAFPHTLGVKRPGVYGHAYAAETILFNKPVRKTPPWADMAASLLCAAFFAAILQLKKRTPKVVLITLLPLAVFIAELVLLRRLALWLSYSMIFTAFVTVTAAHWIFRRIRLTSELRRAIGFDPRLIESFQKKTAGTGGFTQRDVCILCSDVRGYTLFVSDASPDTAAVIMKEYLQRMESIVADQGGYINKYVGDEIIAVFGFPLNEERKEPRGVAAALAMLNALRELKDTWEDRKINHFKEIGIGLDSGPATFSEMGGRTKRQFDIIGSCINGASRLQELTKDKTRRIVLSREVFLSLEDSDIREFFTALGAVDIRGQGERHIFGLKRKRRNN